DDAIGRNVGALGGLANGLRVRRLIKAIGLSLVRAQKREYPLHSDIIIDALDVGGLLLGDLKAVCVMTFDDKSRHSMLLVLSWGFPSHRGSQCCCPRSLLLRATMSSRLAVVQASVNRGSQRCAAARPPRRNMRA